MTETPYLGGIPVGFHRLATSTSPLLDIVTGKSGESIIVQKLFNVNGIPQAIQIFDEYREFYLVTYLENNKYGKGIIFNLNTKYPDGTHHPDFYAGAFVDAAMTEYQEQITNVVFSWDKPTYRETGEPLKLSDNYTQFTQNVRELYRINHKERGLERRSALLHVRESAAFETRTGERIARRYGFHTVEVRKVHGYYTGYFRR